MAESTMFGEVGGSTQADSQSVKTQVLGNILKIEIDLTKEEGRSASGKTIVIASTHGNKVLGMPNGKVCYLGVNCYKK